MKKNKLYLLSVLFLFTTANLTATEEIFNPTDDTFIFWAGSKTTNYGDSALLEVRFVGDGAWRRDTFIKFDISSSEATTSYDNATLRLYGSDASTADVRIRVLAVRHTETNYDWDESTLVFSNKPNTHWENDSIAEITTVGDGEAKYFEWDITDWVNDEKTAGRDIINLHIRQMNMPGDASGAITLMSFHSKENASGNKPELLLSYEGTNTSVQNTEANNVSVTVNNGVLSINNADKKEAVVEIFSLTGSLVKKAIVQNSLAVPELSGLYIVKIDGNSQLIAF